MIFPGMDPYLEDARLWPGVHLPFIVYASDALQPSLRPRYIAAIEARQFLVQHRLVQAGEARFLERYIAILDMSQGGELITVIEVVSTANKCTGSQRRSYVEHQRNCLNRGVHLVEIDLLRNGRHVLAVAESVAKNHGPYDYLICVNRGQGERNKCELYPRTLRQRLPKISVPLAGNDPDVAIDVQAVLERTYEQGCYAERLAYDQPCRPPLAKADQAWANRLVKEARRRLTDDGDGNNGSQNEGSE